MQRLCNVLCKILVTIVCGECLRGLEGQTIQQKSGGGKEEKIFACDPYGENLVKATLPRSGWKGKERNPLQEGM
jgi:hypothetical protein